MTMVGGPNLATIRRISRRSVCEPWKARIRGSLTNALSAMSTPMTWARGKNHFHIRNEAPPWPSRAYPPMPSSSTTISRSRSGAK